MLTAQQETARKLIIDWFNNSKSQIFVLSGYAGTGKTFLLNEVIQNDLNLSTEPDSKHRVAFVAPTGKAATVLIQKGMQASTVHHLIYNVVEDEEEIALPDGTTRKIKTMRFVKRKDLPDLDLIVCDEISMVPDDMLEDLLSFKIKILCTGDNGQLDPVKGYNTIIQKPNFQLTEIVRQAKDNPIIYLASIAREGQPIKFGRYGDNVLVLSKASFNRDFEQQKQFYSAADQIICGTNMTRSHINNMYRSMICGIDNAMYAEPLDGEKVICVQNNWNLTIDSNQQYSLVNGIIGTVKNRKSFNNYISQFDFKADFLNESTDNIVYDSSIFYDYEYRYQSGQMVARTSSGELVLPHKIPPRTEVGKTISKKQYIQMLSENVQLSKITKQSVMLNRFEFAYAISCHKSQGSEFADCLVINENYCFKKSKSKWLYTAITRAKKNLILVM